MIELKHVSKIYRNKRGAETKALNDVSLILPSQGIVFVTGKSGCGKSTLLNICGGLDRSDEGEIVVNGKNIVNFTSKEFDSYRNINVGFIFQEYNLLDDFSVFDNIKLALELQGKRVDGKQIEEIAAMVGIGDLLDRKAKTLSGGQKQRVAIARALVKKPAFILADEPTGALDSENGEQVMATLRNLSSNKLVIVVSHDKEQAERYADRIIEMSDGKIVNDCSVHQSAAETEKVRVDKNQTYRLPWRYTFKIGISSLKVKPIRLAFTILLSLVAFLCLGLFSTTVFYNEQNTAIETLSSSSDFAYLKTSKGYQRELVQYKGSDILSRQTQTIKTGYTLQETKAILSEYPGAIAAAETPGGLYIFNFTLPEEKGFFYKGSFDGLALVNSSMKWICGYAPQQENEIAITDFMFETLQQGEFKDVESEENIVLNTYKDIVGKTIALTSASGRGNTCFTISGVFQGEKIPQSFNQLHNDALQNEIWSSTNEIRRWNTVRDIGVYCIAAMSEEGLTKNSDLIRECIIKGENSSSFFLLNPNRVSLFLDMGGQEVSAYLENYPYISSYKNVTGNGLLEMYGMDGQVVSKLNDGTIGISAQAYANLVDPLFEEYFARTGDDALLDRSEYIDADLALLNGADSAHEMIEQLKTIREMMDICSIDEPSVILRSDNGEVYHVKVGGIFYTARSVAALYVSDSMFEALYKGDVDISIHYDFYTEYEDSSQAIYTAVYVPFGRTNIIGVLSDIYALEEDDSTVCLVNPLYDEVCEFSSSMQVFFKLFLVGGAIFCAFAILLIFNFISTSIITQKRQVGILRALGARALDVFKIFLMEAMTIALTCTILSCIGTGILCQVLNTVLTRQIGITNVNMFVFSPISACLIAVVAIFTALFSTWIPVTFYSRRPPAESIKEI